MTRAIAHWQVDTTSLAQEIHDPINSTSSVMGFCWGWRFKFQSYF